MTRSLPAAFLPLAVFVALLVGHWVPGHANEASDSMVLVAGAEVALGCLRDGVFFECGTDPAALAAARKPYPVVKSAVAPFPLFQYLAAVPLLAAGASPGQVLVALSLLSIAAFLGLLALLWRTAERTGTRAWAPVLALVALAGPLLWYASSTFGEMLAAFLVLLFVATVLARSSWVLIASTLWLAGITKETALPFLLALGVVALYAVTGRPRRAQLIGLAAGASAALVTNAAFNLFRFGSVVNEEYFAGANFTELYGITSVPFLQRLEFLAGLLVAPNGGLLVFWPLAALLFGAAVFVAWRSRRAADAWPAGVLVAVLLTLLAGFASFYQPYGWFAWGSRLIVPWVPALVLLGVVRYGRWVNGALARLTSTPRRIAVAAAVVSLLAMPHVAVAREPDLAQRVFQGDVVCPWDRPEALRGDRWFDCIDHIAWEKRTALVDGLDGYRSSSLGTLLFFGAFVPACVGMLALARDRVSAEDGLRGAPRSP